MLRKAVLAIGAGFVLLAVIVAAAGGPLPVALWLAVMGLVLLAGILLERGRYKPAEDLPPGPGWEATDEHFVDPETGDEVSVFFRRATGERRYVKRRRMPTA